MYIYAGETGITIPEKTDDLYPLIALNHLGVTAGIAFLLGIIAAAYSSADSALTALTTTFSVDFLKIDRYNEQKRQKIKKRVHIMFSVLLIVVILMFRLISNESIVVAVFKVAGYTYGPILGLFVFGIYSKRVVKDRWVPFVGVISPLISYLLSVNSEQLFNGYQFGFEILIVNGLLTLAGLTLISKKNKFN
ncbi:MAG: hypothetical protein PHH93_02265 [Prolixibacteraceae bacterium]|nr:hypothetical protein [Prolixibacteraceae bacterium]